jgi:Leucine-rich repeat (LRR) protein
VINAVNMPNLTNLTLFDNQISDFSSLADMTGLVYLNIHSNLIGDVNMVHLAGLTPHDALKRGSG